MVRYIEVRLYYFYCYVLSNCNTVHGGVVLTSASVMRSSSNTSSVLHSGTNKSEELLPSEVMLKHNCSEQDIRLFLAHLK